MNILVKLISKRVRIFSIIILLFTHSFNIYGQKKYMISVPTRNYSSISQPGATDALDVQALIDEVTKYAKLIKRNICATTLDPEIERQLKLTMKKITNESPYILTVDYEECKFISLVPDKGTGAIGHPNFTTYYIKLYEEIKRDPVIKAKIDTISKPLLVTYKTENSKWIAWGPYMQTDEFQTESLAIESLFYDVADYSFCCQRGKYKIYKLNSKVEHSATNIRFALEQLGINDIPKP